MGTLVWWWRHWRARHYVWAADVEYRRHPTPARGAAWARAIEHLHRLEIGKP